MATKDKKYIYRVYDFTGGLNNRKEAIWQQEKVVVAEHLV